jgi:hypothetical protein
MGQYHPKSRSEIINSNELNGTDERRKRIEEKKKLELNFLQASN